jgi:hypothetical protein
MPASSTAGVGTCDCIVGGLDPVTGAALFEPLRVKTVLNLSKARPKLARLPARSAAGCCGESSCAPDDIVVIACQGLFFLADPVVIKAMSRRFVGGPNSREQVMGRNDAIKPDKRCREPAHWVRQARL